MVWFREVFTYNAYTKKKVLNLNLITKRVKGMQDVLPDQSVKWQTIEKVMKEEASLYGFKLIRTPVLEHTELFERSGGNTSDMVEKEMYTFNDKGNRSVTLRPEGTAGALRAVLENGLHGGALPLKLMYETACYRYEKPQSGRLREFFQFGLEIIGASDSMADAELICVSDSILKRLGIQEVRLEINSIGCPKCRSKFNEELKSYFEAHYDSLCPTCRDRLLRNPMRIFDCKNPKCAEVFSDAPVILDYICEECAAHFENLKNCLEKVKIKYTVNPKIVRGLDYYSKTVFEFVCDIDGSPITICGGGRYDGLSEILGGPSLPAIGFGMGMERILMIMERQNILFESPGSPEVYIASIGNKAKLKALELCECLRRSSVVAELDMMNRNLKSQMKYANKIGATYTLVLGEDEVNSGSGKIKEMNSGKEFSISLNESFINDFLDIQFENYRKI